MAQYPGATAGDSNLYIAKNNLSTALNGAINNSVTTITVTSTTGFPTTGYITIELEAISYTGVTGTQFTGCTRGADGTTAASHADALEVFHNIVAAHHNLPKDEIIAIETDLRDTFSSITPVTAANTATSLLQRMAHIVSQIKTGFGLTNWYDTVNNLPVAIDNRSKNLLINGGFEFWQRNTTFTTPANQTYTADRWLILRGGAGTPAFTISQESGTSNVDTVGANNLGLYSAKMDVTTVSTMTDLRFQQKLENNSYTGTKTITASCRVKTSVAGKINLAILGPAQSASSSYHTGGGGWETLTATLTTVNSGGTVSVVVGFNDFAPTVSTSYFDSVMLTFGTGLATFIPTEYQEELAQCQRFYFKTFDIATAPAQNTGVNIGALGYSIHTAGIFNDSACLTYPVRMRTVPTITTYSVGAATADWWNASAGTASGVPVVINTSSTRSVDIRNPQVAGDLVNQFIQIHVTADAEI